MRELGEALVARLAVVPGNRVVGVVAVELEGQQPSASSPPGSTIGMSLVVLIVGQARFEPADQPMYLMPFSTRALSGPE